MSYPQARPLPQLAAVRGQLATLTDSQLRQIILQLCDAVDYLNAQLHKTADAVPVVLEE